MTYDEKGKRIQCDVDGMCQWFEKRTGPYNDRAKGFQVIKAIDNDLKTVFRGVLYRMGRGDKGLAINYCPFCGGRPGPIAQPIDA